ncbi:Uncharacterised protein [Mycobacteroides abscessus subsp. massiliense]|nr:Uncharacterised protein [Mycobacteroides abscessus subsp. massiliense]
MCGAGRRRRRSQWVRRFLVGVQQLENSFCAGQSGLQRVVHRGHLCQWLIELSHILAEGLDATQRQTARGHLEAADHCDRHVAQVPDERCRR